MQRQSKLPDRLCVLRARLIEIRERAEVDTYGPSSLEDLGEVITDLRNALGIGSDTMAAAMGIAEDVFDRLVWARKTLDYRQFQRVVEAALQLCWDDGPDSAADPKDGRADWRASSNATVQDKIGSLATSLGEVLLIIKGANDPTYPVTQIQKSQLIAMLETALALLKAPLIEVGLFRRIASRLKAAAGKAAEKEVESAFGAAADRAGQLIGDLLDSL
jgi:hypothetical protein